MVAAPWPPVPLSAIQDASACADHMHSRWAFTVSVPAPPAAGTSGVLFVTETAHLLGVGPTTLVLLLDPPQPAGALISSSAIAIDAGAEREQEPLRAAMAIDLSRRGVEGTRARAAATVAMCVQGTDLGSFRCGLCGRGRVDQS